MKSGFLFALSLVMAGGVALGACAQASGGFGDDDDDDDDDKSSASSSSASSSSSSSASSSSGVGGAGSTSSSGAGGSECSESPCKLVAPQCGCDDGKQCTISNLKPACKAEGDVEAGKQCGLGANCEPGTLCVSPAESSVSICERFCDADNQCTGPGGLCAIKLNDGNGGTLPGVTLCSENCDPASAATCPVAGTGCRISQEEAGQMRFFTSCGGAGAGQQGATCMSSGDCAPSFSCFDTGQPSMVCLKYCKVNSPVCPGSSQCVPLQINMTDIVIGNQPYGACLDP